MCYVAFLVEGIGTDELSCLVSPMGSGQNGMIGKFEMAMEKN